MYVENILWRRLLFNHPVILMHGQHIEWTDWTSKTHMQDGSHMMVGLDLTFVPHRTLIQVDGLNPGTNTSLENLC